MTEFERINAPRIEKILKMLEVIEKSAKSNREHPGEILTPVAEALGLANTMAGELAQRPVEVKSGGHPLPHLDMARALPLRDAVDVMSIIATRIEQELFERA